MDIDKARASGARYGARELLSPSASCSPTGSTRTSSVPDPGSTAAEWRETSGASLAYYGLSKMKQDVDRGREEEVVTVVPVAPHQALAAGDGGSSLSSSPYAWSGYDYRLNFTNETDSSVEPDLWRDIPLGILLFGLCILTFVGNAMVLHAVRTERRLQTVSNMFIVSLAIADLFVGLTVMPISAIYIFTSDWLFGVAVCQIWIGMDYTASTASILNLFILSMDRYWSVTAPLKYIRKRTKKRALIMIFFVWFVSTLWIIPIAGWHHFAHGSVRTVPDNVCDTEYATDSVFKVVTAFFNFYLPLAIMYCLYIKIFQEIRKRSEFELGQRSIGGQSPNNYAPVPTIVSAEEDSDQRNDTFGEDTTTPSGGNEEQQRGVTFQNQQNHGGDAKRPLRSHESRVVSTQPQKIWRNNTRSVPEGQRCENRHQVEYIYDENVIDPITEKVERYFYEEHSLLCFKHTDIISNPGAQAETSLCAVAPIVNVERTRSKGGTPSSRKRKPKPAGDKGSVLSGIRRIREAEVLLDKQVSLSSSRMANRRHRRESELSIDLKDDKNRRLAAATNVKGRLKIMKRSSSLTKEIKAARQLGVIMGAFTLCFLPYFILFMVVAFCNGCIESGLITAMTWIGYLNSTLNPFLYPLCNANFRRKFRKMFGYDRNERQRRFETIERNSVTVRYD